MNILQNPQNKKSFQKKFKMITNKIFKDFIFFTIELVLSYLINNISN